MEYTYFDKLSMVVALSFIPSNSIKIVLSYLSIILLFSRCSILQYKSKYQFGDGYYTSNTFETTKRVYVAIEDESYQVFPVVSAATGVIVDTSENKSVTLPLRYNSAVQNEFSFRQNSYDIDFLTIPFKYRPSTQNFPRQFNAQLNGAVYMGYRTDAFRIAYKQNILGKHIRDLKHYGFSFGAFCGLGGTAMNPWVTRDALSIEYDGVVWTKGIATIIGVNAFTLGIVAGWDDLLDRNKSVWIYQRQPWIGFAFGLNLN